MNIISQPFPNPRNLPEAEAQIAAIGALLAARQLKHRAPPAPPTSCCGRGCNGCVWEGYYTALNFWREDARALLEADAGQASQ